MIILEVSHKHPAPPTNSFQFFPHTIICRLVKHWNITFCRYPVGLGHWQKREVKLVQGCLRRNDVNDVTMYWTCFKTRFSEKQVCWQTSACVKRKMFTWFTSSHCRSGVPWESFMHCWAWHLCISASVGLEPALLLTDFHGEVGNRLKCCIRGQPLHLVKLSFCIPGFRHGLHCHEPSQELVTHDSCMVTWVQIICVVHTKQKYSKYLKILKHSNV